MAESRRRKFLEFKSGMSVDEVEEYEKILAQNPNNALDWILRGIFLMRMERHIEALESYNKGLAIDTQNTLGLVFKGMLLNNLERYKEAVDSFNKSLGVEPKSAWVLGCRGVTLANMGRYRQAMQSYDKAVAIDPSSDTVWEQRAETLYDLGRYQEAVECYEKALTLKPNLTKAWGGKIEALNRLDEWLSVRRPTKPILKLYELVTASEERLHLFIRQRLQKALGNNEDEWWAKGVPKTIRNKCVQRREDDILRQDPFGYTDLIDLKEIIDYSWRFFNDDFQQAKLAFKSKKEFLDGLVRLNEIRRIVAHPVRNPPSEEDFKFASDMREVIEQFCGVG